MTPSTRMAGRGPPPARRGGGAEPAAGLQEAEVDVVVGSRAGRFGREAAGPVAGEVDAGLPRPLLRDRRAELIAGAVQLTAEVFGSAPAGSLRAGHVDVGAAAAAGAGAHEEEPAVLDRRGAEVVGAGVNGRAGVDRGAPGGSRAGAAGDPAVDAALAAGAVRSHVEAEAVRRFDGAAVEDGRGEP